MAPETRIYAKDGMVVYEMEPWIAQELAILFPTGDKGWMDDFPELLKAAHIAKGNSPEDNG